MFSSVEDKTDVAVDKASDSAPSFAAAQQPHEIAEQEIFQPQPSVVPVAEDILDDKENQLEVITSSTKLEEFGMAEHTEEKDTVVREVDLI